MGLVGKLALDPRADERVDRAEERRKRLARAGGGGDEGVPARLDRRPCRDLRRRRPGERRPEPVLDRWVEELEDLVGHCLDCRPR